MRLPWRMSCQMCESTLSRLATAVEIDLLDRGLINDDGKWIGGVDLDPNIFELFLCWSEAEQAERKSA